MTYHISFAVRRIRAPLPPDRDDAALGKAGAGGGGSAEGRHFQATDGAARRGVVLLQYMGFWMCCWGNEPPHISVGPQVSVDTQPEQAKPRGVYRAVFEPAMKP